MHDGAPSHFSLSARRHLNAHYPKIYEIILFLALLSETIIAATILLRSIEGFLHSSRI
jgi:hypothetical protein